MANYHWKASRGTWRQWGEFHYSHPATSPPGHRTNIKKIKQSPNIAQWAFSFLITFKIPSRRKRPHTDFLCHVLALVHLSDEPPKIKLHNGAADTAKSSPVQRNGFRPADSLHHFEGRRFPFESLPFVLLTLLHAAPCQTICYSLEASAASYIRWNLPSCNYLFWELWSLLPL